MILRMRQYRNTSEQVLLKFIQECIMEHGVEIPMTVFDCKIMDFFDVISQNIIRNYKKVLALKGLIIPNSNIVVIPERVVKRVLPELNRRDYNANKDN